MGVGAPAHLQCYPSGRVEPGASSVREREDHLLPLECLRFVRLGAVFLLERDHEAGGEGDARESYLSVPQLGGHVSLPVEQELQGSVGLSLLCLYLQVPLALDRRSQALLGEFQEGVSLRVLLAAGVHDPGVVATGGRVEREGQHSSAWLEV